MIIVLASPLEEAALAWWRTKRPLDWDENQHLKNPTINTTTHDEARLARSVARTLRTRGKGRTQKSRR